MTVAELRAVLEGMADDREVYVRIQGLSRPLSGVFTETEVRTIGDATARSLILSDRRGH